MVRHCSGRPHLFSCRAANGSATSAAAVLQFCSRGPSPSLLLLPVQWRWVLHVPGVQASGVGNAMRLLLLPVLPVHMCPCRCCSCCLLGLNWHVRAAAAPYLMLALQQPRFTARCVKWQSCCKHRLLAICKPGWWSCTTCPWWVLGLLCWIGNGVLRTGVTCTYL
jgi:hypothetical protein